MGMGWSRKGNWDIGNVGWYHPSSPILHFPVISHQSSSVILWVNRRAWLSRRVLGGYSGLGEE